MTATQRAGFLGGMVGLMVVTWTAALFVGNAELSLIAGTVGGMLPGWWLGERAYWLITRRL